MFLGRPYWARLWLVKELVLAKDAAVVAVRAGKHLRIWYERHSQLLIGDQHLELFGAVQFVEERADLPSWVIDWSVGWVYYPLKALPALMAPQAISPPARVGRR
jgi:hypothetical protein